MFPPSVPVDEKHDADLVSAPAHDYIRSGHVLLSAREHPVRLVSRLWRYADVFGLGSPEAGLHPRLVRRNLLALRAVIRIVLPTLPQRRRPRRLEHETLPEPGHLAIALRYGGYKVFDLDREIVITRLPASLAPDLVAAHIARAEEAGRHGFAPTVVRADATCGRYEETIVRGPHPPSIRSEPRRLSVAILPLITSMCLAGGATRLVASDYADVLDTLARRAIPHGDEPHLEGLDGRQLERILQYVDHARSAIGSHEQTLLRTLSHGDMHGGNVIMSPSGPMLIDWDNLGYRSLLYDLWMVLFRAFRPAGAFRPPGWVDPDLSSVRRTMSEAVEDLQRHLEGGGFRPAHDLSAHHETYRAVFYLEFVVNRLEKLRWVLSLHGRAEVLDEIEDWITTFERFERDIAACA